MNPISLLVAILLLCQTNTAFISDEKKSPDLLSLQNTFTPRYGPWAQSSKQNGKVGSIFSTQQSPSPNQLSTNEIQRNQRFNQHVQRLIDQKAYIDRFVEAQNARIMEEFRQKYQVKRQVNSNNQAQFKIPYPKPQQLEESQPTLIPQQITPQPPKTPTQLPLALNKTTQNIQQTKKINQIPSPPRIKKAVTFPIDNSMTQNQVPAQPLQASTEKNSPIVVQTPSVPPQTVPPPLPVQIGKPSAQNKSSIAQAPPVQVTQISAPNSSQINQKPVEPQKPQKQVEPQKPQKSVEPQKPVASEPQKFNPYVPPKFSGSSEADSQIVDDGAYEFLSIADDMPVAIDPPINYTQIQDIPKPSVIQVPAPTDNSTTNAFSIQQSSIPSFALPVPVNIFPNSSNKTGESDESLAK